MAMMSDTSEDHEVKQRTAVHDDNTPTKSSEFSIKTIHGNPHNDSMYISTWRQNCSRFLSFTSFAVVLLTIYTSFLQLRSLSSLSPTLSSWRASSGYITLYLNLLLSLPTLALSFLQLNTLISSLSTYRPQLQLLGEDEKLPFINVIITVCNEPFDIIIDTLTATLSLDYPPSRFHIIISDDGNSGELLDYIQHVNLEHFKDENKIYPKIFYTARDKTGAAGYKAGSLNHCVRFLEELEGENVEFLAGLDVDMIPEARWLRACLPWLLRDEGVGCVCAAQAFYNTPTNDPLHQARSMDWILQERLRDAAGVAWNTGSGWIIRKSALQATSGFPESCVLEDVYSSMLMLSRGWRTVYVAEALQWGLVPESYDAHVRQFTRWTIGACQMAQGFQWGLKKTQFSTYQLLTGHCCAIITIFAPFLQTGLIILTPFSVFFGIPAVYATGSEQLHGLLRLQYFITIFGYLNSLNVSLVSGFRPAMREQSLQLYMAPYHVMAVLRTFFVPTWLGGHGPGFTPTGTLQSKVYERDASKRAPLRLRLWHICIECGAWFHALVGVTVLLSLAYQIPRLKTDEGFVMTLAWPSLIWLYILESMMKPLAYAILPPDVPERRMLLEKKAGADARYPDRKNGQARWMWLGLDVGYLRTGIALYSLVLLLRSFYR